MDAYLDYVGARGAAVAPALPTAPCPRLRAGAPHCMIPPRLLPETVVGVGDVGRGVGVVDALLLSEENEGSTCEGPPGKSRDFPAWRVASRKRPVTLIRGSLGTSGGGYVQAGAVQMRFLERVAVVTGATGGIGTTTRRRLAEVGGRTLGPHGNTWSPGRR